VYYEGELAGFCAKFVVLCRLASFCRKSWWKCHRAAPAIFDNRIKAHPAEPRDWLRVCGASRQRCVTHNGFVFAKSASQATGRPTACAT
jgi:hypothetical protein